MPRRKGGPRSREKHVTIKEENGKWAREEGKGEAKEREMDREIIRI